MPSCGAEKHLFFSHLAIDASDTSASRTWGPCRPDSPIAPSEASYDGRNELEECLDNDGRSVASTVCATKRHKTPRFFVFFASHFRDGVRISSSFLIKKKKATRSPAVRLISTRRRPPRVFLQNKWPCPRHKKNDRGCTERALWWSRPDRAIVK